MTPGIPWGGVVAHYGDVDGGVDPPVVLHYVDARRRAAPEYVGSVREDGVDSPGLGVPGELDGVTGVAGEAPGHDGDLSVGGVHHGLYYPVPVGAAEGVQLGAVAEEEAVDAVLQAVLDLVPEALQIQASPLVAGRGQYGKQALEFLDHPLSCNSVHVFTLFTLTLAHGCGQGR
jgi:hypothetical protein